MVTLTVCMMVIEGVVSRGVNKGLSFGSLVIDLLGPLSDGKIFQVEAAIFVTIIWLMRDGSSRLLLSFIKSSADRCFRYHVGQS